MLPNFLCVGAQKAGTTTLFNLLNQHPDIFLPEIKEVNFFNREKKWSRGVKSYEKVFSGVGKERAVGEISPDYMYFNKVPQRIKSTLGKKIKLIFMLRNPIDRAYSHYWGSRNRGFETESFEKAIALEQERLKEGGYFEKVHFSYVDRGFYAKQIRRFLKYFPRKNMKFIIFEDFIEQESLILEELSTFLGIEEYREIKYNVFTNPASQPRSTLVNALFEKSLIKKTGRFLIPVPRIRRYLRRLNQKPFKKPPMEANTYQILFKKYEEDMRSLQDIIGKDLSSWLESAKPTKI